MDRLDGDIALWRTAITRDSAVDSADADELEGHLREQIAELADAGLSHAEAFQIAVQRLGRVDQLTAEFAREHGERLWKQLAMPAPEGASEKHADGRRTAAVQLTGRGSLVEMIVFAALAAIAVQLARLFAGIPTAVAPWFVRDLGLFVLPLLGAYFAWRRRMPRPAVLIACGIVVAAALVVNLYPLRPNGQAEILTAVHLPVVLWFVVGAAYLGGGRGRSGRMEFIRFTGEWVIYWVLLALGGGVLMGLTALVLSPLVPGAIGEVMLWVLPSGGAAAAIVAAWLVEAKKSIVENLAPVLAAVFTPLFAAMLLVVAVVYAIAGIGRSFDRSLVTVFDVLLLVVFGLVLYSLSARDRAKPAGALDVIGLAAVVAALLVDALVLVSMLTRIADFGFTANRIAALGLNLVLVVNLVVTAWISARMIARRSSVARLEQWQTGFLPVFGAWAAVVVVVLPPLFAFA